MMHDRGENRFAQDYSLRRLLLCSATYFVSNGGSNTAPYDTEAKAATSLGTINALPWTAADLVRVANTHAESTGAAIVYLFPTTPGLQVLSVAFNGLGTGGLVAGASVAVGAANAAVTLGGGFVYGYGITFAAGTNVSANCDMILGSGIVPTGHKWESTTFSVPSTAATALMTIGQVGSASNDDIQYDLVNCTFSYGGAKTVRLQGGVINITNLTLAGTAPTTVFEVTAGAPLLFTLDASDLSNQAWTNLVSVSDRTYGRLVVQQCKLRSGFVVTTGAFPGPGAVEVELIDCASGDAHYTYQKHCWEGTVVAVDTIYANASDGTNTISWLMTGNANTSFAWPLVSPPIAFFNAALSSITTLVPVTNDGTTFTNAQLWNETLAKITSGSTKGTWNLGDRVADILTTPANQASSTQTWTGTGGFGAEVKQQLESGAFTPAEVGWVMTVIKLAANDNVYVSPNITGTNGKCWMAPNGAFVNEAASGAISVASYHSMINYRTGMVGN